MLDRLDEAIADFDAAFKLDDGSKAAEIRKDRAAALAKKAAEEAKAGTSGRETGNQEAQDVKSAENKPSATKRL